MNDSVAPLATVEVLQEPPPLAPAPQALRLPLHRTAGQGAVDLSGWGLAL